MIKVKVATRSEKGPVRKDNQDSVLVDEKSGLFAIADGMGGGDEGALASKMVCEAIVRHKSLTGGADRKRALADAVGEANSAILRYVKEHRLRQMGSTVAILSLGEGLSDRACIGYVGDSRVYRICGKSAQLLTRDHSVGAELDSQVGGVSGVKFSDRSNPLSHLLTRVIGAEDSVEVEWRESEVRTGDRFLVCSDGVHDVVETDDIGRLVSVGGIEKAAAALEAAVLERGTRDNYSFVLVEIGGGR